MDARTEHDIGKSWLAALRRRSESILEQIEFIEDEIATARRKHPRWRELLEHLENDLDEAKARLAESEDDIREEEVAQGLRPPSEIVTLKQIEGVDMAAVERLMAMAAA